MQTSERIQSIQVIHKAKRMVTQDYAMLPEDWQFAYELLNSVVDYLIKRL